MRKQLLMYCDKDSLSNIRDELRPVIVRRIHKNANIKFSGV